MKIFAFDFGTSSLGVAAHSFKESYEFDLVESLIFDDEFASTKDAAKARRQLRNREAHHAREDSLRKFFISHNLKEAVLYGQQNAFICPECDTILYKDRHQGKKQKTCNDSNCDRFEQKGVWRCISEGDDQLKREFPAKDDQTAYCGALLRCMLYKGESLEPWQIFKAFHSAIQKRGYDSDVPWKRGVTEMTAELDVENNQEDEDSKANSLRATGIQEVIHSLPEDHRSPCFWECKRMHLWSPKSPDQFNLRITHLAQNTKEESSVDDPNPNKDLVLPLKLPAVYPRKIVEQELRQLYLEAEKQLPALKGKVNAFIHGIGEVEYASYIKNQTSKYPTCSKKIKQTLSDKGQKLIQGKATDWSGVLGQKIPNFDNRQVNSCTLFPKFKVARAMPRMRAGTIIPDTLLPSEISFLLQLKNLRFIDKAGLSQVLSAQNIKDILKNQSDLGTKALLKAIETHPTENLKAISAHAKYLKLTKTQLSKYLIKMLPKTWKLQGEKVEIEVANIEGRSKFSRPACKILKALILSGLSPDDFSKALLLSDDYKDLRTELQLNGGKSYNLTTDDLSFLCASEMGDTWDKLYIPDTSLNKYNALVGRPKETRFQAIQELIGLQNNPVVRHRLTFFWKKIQHMEKTLGTPDRVVLELVRDDFMGKKAKEKLKKLLEDNRKNREKYIVEEKGSTKNIKKRQLLEEQKWVCPYSGDPLKGINLGELEIEHIVPRSLGGSDQFYNLCLTTPAANKDKDKLTPYQWLHDEDKPQQWQRYIDRVRETYDNNKSNKKIQLLTSPNAEELVESYQKLAETSWIAKIAKQITCLHFGWKVNAENEQQRVVVTPGALTSQVGRRYGLYTLLENKDAYTALHKARKSRDNTDPEDAETRKQAIQNVRKAEVRLDKKNRSDKRHHALDAMILSMLPHWTVDKKKRSFYNFDPHIIGESQTHKETVLSAIKDSSEFINADTKMRKSLKKRAVSKIKSQHAKDYFSKVLDDVFPFKEGKTAPAFLDTIYSKKGNKVYLRRLIRDLPFETKNYKIVYSPETPAKKLEKIEPSEIKNVIEGFYTSNPKPTKDEWFKFCENLTLANGSYPQHYRGSVGNADKYLDLSKDQNGAYRCTKTHKGYYIYKNSKGKYLAKSVYAFQRKADVYAEIDNDPDTEKIIDFFYSGCHVSISETASAGETVIPSGQYILNSLDSQGQIKLTNAVGEKFKPMVISHLVNAGLTKVK